MVINLLSNGDKFITTGIIFFTSGDEFMYEQLVTNL